MSSWGWSTAQKSAWKWRPASSEGIWHYGPKWLRPFCAAIPFLTVLLSLALVYMIGTSMTLAEGVAFSLPERTEILDAEATPLLALVMPGGRDTLVFFDDARYTLSDETSRELFAERLAERVAKAQQRTLLLLCDRRLAAGELMRLAGHARASGVERILFATKNQAAGSDE